MKVLITGVAGLIGSNFAEYLIKKDGIEIIGIDDLSGGYEENVPKGVIFKNLNLLNSHEVTSIFKEYNIDYVFHFAAYAAEGLSPFY